MATSTTRLVTAVLLTAVAITILIPPRHRPRYLPNGHGQKSATSWAKPDTFMWVNILSERPGCHDEVTVTYPGKPGQQDRADCQYVVNKERRRCKWTIFDDKNNAWDESGQSMVWYVMGDCVYQENLRKVNGVEIGPTNIRVRHWKLFTLGDAGNRIVCK